MKQLFSFMIVLFFIGCKSPEKKSLEENQSSKEITSGEESKSPKETVQAYLAATNRFDDESAKEFLVPNTENQMQLETLKKMKKSLPDERKSSFLNKEKDAVYTEKEITDSIAKIIVSPKEIAMPFEFRLIKVNNVWMIESIKEL